MNINVNVSDGHAAPIIGSMNLSPTQLAWMRDILNHAKPGIPTGSVSFEQGDVASWTFKGGTVSRWEYDFFQYFPPNVILRYFEAYPSSLQIEAAQCIWEHILENRKHFDPFFKELGSAEFRDRLRDPQILDACCAGWDSLTQDEQEDFAAYDWEYVPWFVDNCLQWDDPKSVMLKPDWLHILKCEATKRESGEVAA